MAMRKFEDHCAMAGNKGDRHSTEILSSDPRQWRIAASLFCLSFGTALFALGVFKLLSFFIMPSLFFDLLFIGFPLGALVGARFFRVNLRSFVNALASLQVIMVASVASCLLAKRFDYLRAHLFEIHLPWLIAQIGVFVGLFLPFFAAYGLCEYLGYQVGRRQLGGRMRLVYAIALFGAAAAYLALKTCLPIVGMLPILAAAFGSIALASLALSKGLARWVFALELAALLAGSLAPGADSAFLSLCKGKGVQSTWDFIANQGCRSVFQKWGRYSFCEILEESNRGTYYGFYNDMFQWEYKPRMGFAGPSLGAIPILLSRPGQHLAIIGAGGGRQVRLAERLGGRTITAIELEPAVFEAVRCREHLLQEFGAVYEAPGVTPIRGEARSFLEHTRDRYDLIYLPSVGGYPQMMIEPGNMVRTYQAYRTMREHLTDSGVLAIWYPRGLDSRGILTDQYVRTLRSLGLRTEAYRNEIEFLILGFRNPVAVVPTEAELAGMLRLGDSADDPDVLRTLSPHSYAVEDDPLFTPISDRKPFLAGNVRYILSMTQVGLLFGLAGSVVACAGAVLWLGLRRRGDPRLPGRSYAAVTVLALLIGANFLLMEHALVVALFRRIYVYDDALGLGVVSFLTLSGLGSLLTAPAVRPWLVGVALVSLACFLALEGQTSSIGIVFLIAPAALVTGTMFPALFDQTAGNPLAVFAFDAVGSALGALLATFVPLAWGLDTLLAVAGTGFLLTVIVETWFNGRSIRERLKASGDRHDSAPAEYGA
jgi:spermidine synthase